MSAEFENYMENRFQSWWYSLPGYDNDSARVTAKAAWEEAIIRARIGLLKELSQDCLANVDGSDAQDEVQNDRLFWASEWLKKQAATEEREALDV